MMDRLIEYANEKFQTLKNGRWMMHDWDFGGANYGFELLLIGKDWQLRTFTDSMYGPSKIILQTQDEKIIWALIECFEPTNPSYKTDRK